mgnify:CR=1 FL=1
MKIGMVCYPTYGGSGIVATELGIELAKMGHEVHFISYALPTRLDRFQKNIYFHDVDIPHYPLFEFHLYTLALAGKIIDVCKYEDLDILHVHYAIPHAVSGFLSKEILKNNKELKLVTTLHGTDITLVGLEPSFMPIIRWALEQSDSITAVSRYLKDNTNSHFNTGKDIKIIPNFVDTKFYKRKNRSDFKNQIAPNGEKILMHMSNFRPVKRVADTVEILKEVREKIPAKLILVGDGPDRKKAEQLSRELDLCDHITFFGKQSSVVDPLSISDLFLLPSQSESFGLSSLEAMACEVPVVASNIGGIPEVVEHGESGFVAELGDTKRMAKYAADLLKNEKKHKAFSKRARNRAEELFEASKIVKQYEDLYIDLINS